MLSDDELHLERRLIEAAQHDPSRFAAIYERYHDQIYRFALVRTRDDAAAQDVTSETFKLALENLAKFEWRGVPISAWLYRIAGHCADKLLQRAGRETSLDELDNLPADEWQDDLADADRRLDVGEAIGQLPASQQEIVVKRFGEDVPIRQVAQDTSRSEGSVKLLQHRQLRRTRVRT